MSQPPWLATWLLRRLASGDDALAGDLLQEFQRTRSNRWYWRQVMGAIGAVARSGVRAHPILALRSIAVGSFLLLAWKFILAPVVLDFDDWLYVRGVRWFYMNGYGLPHQGVAVVAMTYVVNGWLVGRTHRSQQTAMVAVYAMFLVCVNAVRLALLLHVVYRRFDPTLALVGIVDVAIMPLAAFVGGTLLRPPSGTTRGVA